MVKFLRLFFLLLIFANLLFFAWGQGYFGSTEEGREPQRLTDQIEPTKLQVTSGVLPAVTPPPEANAATVPTSTEAAPACRLVTGLSLADAQRLQTKAQAEEGTTNGLTLTVKPIEVAPGHWVFIPPLPSKAAAERKMGELKKRGVTNYFLVQDEGIDKLAISLGMFNTDQEANSYLRTLTGRGVRSAIIQLRSRPSEKAQVEAHGKAEVLQRRLAELLANVSGASITECSNGKGK